MNETKFTKGEWELKPTDFYREYELTTQQRLDESKVSILTIDASYSGVIGDEQKANAHLIKSAPKMYQALENILELGMLSIHREDIVSKLLAEARGEK